MQIQAELVYLYPTTEQKWKSCYNHVIKATSSALYVCSGFQLFQLDILVAFKKRNIL